MVLSNTALFEALDDGRLVIDPEPTPRSSTTEQNSPFDRTSVDLTLSRTLHLPKQDVGVNIDSKSDQQTYERALALTRNRGERLYLERRLAEVGGGKSRD